jgi:hypothetical protein
MAGEWIQVDCCLASKPEVLRIQAATGLDADQVVGRLVMLWSWSSLNSSDGTAPIPVGLLCRVCGGDEAFWREVEAVGWLQIDEEAGTVGVPGWEARFSKAAKSRALETLRNKAANAKKDPVTRSARTCTRVARAHNAPSASEEKRGERISSSSPGDAAQASEEPEPATWEELRKAWKAGQGKPWNLPDPPDKAADRLDEPGWFAKALLAIEALPRCRYFRDPVTLPQLVSPGFVDKVLGGQFDNHRDHAKGGRPDDRPSAEAAAAAWSRGASDPERERQRREYLARKAAAAERGRQESGKGRLPKEASKPDEAVEEARAVVLEQISRSAAS